MYFMEKTKGYPVRQVVKHNAPDKGRTFHKGQPCSYFNIRQGILHEKLSLLDKTNFKKERGREMAFFTTAVTGLTTVVTAIGAGVAVWGVINLLEGYGNDNPGANAQVS